MGENNVTKIDVLPDIKKRLKVAAYCRVSKTSDNMHHSLSAQVSNYNKMIQSNPEWEFVGIYADEGISGTKTTRVEFNRMIEDAKQEKINLILTKSISRFARNTMALLTTIRELKEIQVNVFFEEQGIYTLSAEGELMLSLLASVAQEEAHSMSQNMLWRIKKDMENGLLWGGHGCYGYRLNKRDLIVIPEEAKIVRRIFQLYIDGYGDQRIANILNDEHIPSKLGGLWNRTSVLGILTNINYTGDIILQKTYRENYMKHTCKVNRGQRQKYFVEEHHEPIIDIETFEKASAIRKQRRESMKNVFLRNSYPFSDLLKCGVCGHTFKHKNGPYTSYYNCTVYEEKGKKFCKSKRIRDDTLEKVIMNILDMKELDMNKVKKKIKIITVYPNNTLLIEFKDGITKEVTYNDPSRSEGWTPEMKEKARTRSNKQPKGADGKWQKLQ